MSRSILLLVVSTCLFAATLAEFKGDPQDDPQNTKFGKLWTSSNTGGQYVVFQKGVGLGGYDNFDCQPSIKRTLSFPWSTSASTTIRKAFVFWQAGSNATTDAYNLFVDGVSVKSGATDLSTAEYCSHKSGDKDLTLKRSTVWYKDISAAPWLISALNNVQAASVDFQIEFTTPCTEPLLDNLEKSNGVSMIIVAEAPSFGDGIVVQIQVGAVSYDKNSQKHTAPDFLFAIPKVGPAKTQRVDNTFDMKFVAVIGEGENQAGENPEGFIVNGGTLQTIPTIDGNDGAKWDTLSFAINDCDALPAGSTAPCVGDSDTLLNVTVESQRDCLLFVAFALSYEVTGQSGSLSEDPHMETWDGVKVTLKSEGDFIMMDSPTTGLAVHARFSKNLRGPWAPWTVGIAVRCSADSGLVEIKADSFEHPAQVGAAGIRVSTISNRIQQIVCQSTGLIVTAMRFRFHRLNYINVHFQRHSGFPADARGLFGSANDVAEDDLESRDGLRYVPASPKGHFIGHSAPQLVAIQNSWKVQDSEKMFSSVFEAAESSKPSTVRVDNGMSREEARIACRNAGIWTPSRSRMCIHDAIATGSVAGAANLAEWDAVLGQLKNGIPMENIKGF